jgi:phosphatidylinositol glycan class A protein
VVSTKVGGIPEILPGDMMILAEPSVSDVTDKVQLAIDRHKRGDKKDPLGMHKQIEEMYNWRDVARRTEIVYNRVMVTNDQTKNGIDDKLIKYALFLITNVLIFKI